MATFTDLFRVDTGNREVMRAQMAALSKQVPLLYFILVVNAGALAVTFHGIAPVMLTTVVPGVLALACAIRIASWVRNRSRPMTDATIVRQLRRTVVLGAILGAVFLAWSLSLYPYGDIRAQDHVIFFVGITVISCIFCLMHLRPAAFVLTLVVPLPFLAFVFSKGDATLTAIGVNLLLVTGGMIHMLNIGATDFRRMIESQTETRRLSDENARLANVDSLTGLPNRRQFFAELDRRLRIAHEKGGRFAVGVIDLDGFKPVNDRHGHIAGDRILTEVGERLQLVAGEAAFIGRLGGDEFGILLPLVGGTDDALAFGARVCAAIDVPFRIDGVVAKISASVGFATHPQAGSEAATLYERADYALYHAKGSCRGRAVLFSREHEREIRQRGIIEQHLRSADLDRDFTLAFQPLHDIRAGRTIGFEALARWTDPELGSISPAVFVPIAERSDLISRITTTLFAKALAAAATWPDDVRLSFNLSARDLNSSGAVIGLLDQIVRSGVDPRRVDIEVTETSVIADFDKACTALVTLRALGVRIALDDFGTGYSSLSHVHRLPLDKIKVDRSFIKDIDRRRDGRSLVKSVIDLCDNLGIACVIEGVETAEQVAILEDLGCTTMQGYHFGRPMTGEAVAEFLARERDDAPVIAAAGR